MADVARQVRKISAHREPPSGEQATPRGKTARALARVVACADCHDPHRATDLRAEAPYASGMLAGVSGIDRNGALVRAATYEYEVCFKCHADSTPDFAYVPRVLDTTNLRLAFDPVNASYHPVLEAGKSRDLPSIPSSFEPRMTSSQMIYCTDCHADDEGGAKGPHGSAFPPILRERYETTDGTPESADSYALCYRCHDRNSILSDASFRRKTIGKSASRGGHRGHLAAGASCATCHDPHGVGEQQGGAATGSHTHLVNFDTRLVLPKPGAAVPVFHDTGTFSGSCDLVCHGVLHDGAAYP
jgi:hypothetical protein